METIHERVLLLTNVDSLKAVVRPHGRWLWLLAGVGIGVLAGMGYSVWVGNRLEEADGNE